MREFLRGAGIFVTRVASFDKNGGKARPIEKLIHWIVKMAFQ